MGNCQNVCVQKPNELVVEETYEPNENNHVTMYENEEEKIMI